jgi:hypothetical protein
VLTLTEAEIDAIDGSTQSIGIFFRLATDPVVRLWLGIGPCRVGANALDADGAIYTGFGQLAGVPVVQQLINGVADRVEFQVSGVSQETLRLASSEALDVQGAAVGMGFGIFDGSWQLLGAVKWIFRGFADVVTLNQESVEGGVTRTISLSVGSLFTGRRRRGLSYLTDQDQQLRHPGDRFCERTALYSEESDKVWPRF